MVGSEERISRIRTAKYQDEAEHQKAEYQGFDQAAGQGAEDKEAEAHQEAK